MQKLIVNFKNYKKIAELKDEFDSGNIYLVKAGNMKGKTTFTQAIHTLLIAKNDNDQITTFGETSGKLSGEFIGADNEKYVVSFEFGTEKEDKFILVRPDASTSKKVTDIRNIFQYNAFTAEEFFNWGLSEKGRKEQANVILNLISKEARDKVKNIDTYVNTKDGTLFTKRTDLSNELKAHQSISDKIVFDDKDKKILTNGPAAKVKLAELKEQLSKASGDPEVQVKIITLKEKIANVPILLSESKESAKADADVIKEEITQLEAKIEELKNKGRARVQKHNDYAKLMNSKLTEYEAELVTLEESSGSINEETLTKLKSDIERGDKFMEVYNDLNSKAEMKKETEVKVSELKSSVDELSEQIEKYREERKKIFIEEKLPIDNVYVDEDGLYYIKDGKHLPFNESNISYAEGGIIVAKLLCELNKKTPIICIGKASEYDSNSKKKLADLAKEYNAIMFLDSVTETPEELHIECYINQ